MENILKVEDLSVRFGGNVNALKKVSFEVAHGEILGIVGESGSGKSTLGLSIGRLVDFNTLVEVDGRVYFQEKELLKADQDSLYEIRGSGIFIIFQDPFQSLDPLVTVEEHLSEAFLIIKNKNGEFPNEKEVLENVVLSLKQVNFQNPYEVLKKYPHELSGGQNQRIMIAMAILQKPNLLIADEPTTALDVTTQAQVLSLLEKIVRLENMSLIFITHDLAVASMLCDRILVLYDGMIQEIGRTSDIIENPMHPYTIGLLNSIPSRSKEEGRLKYIKGIYRKDEIKMGCPFYPRCDHHKDECLMGIPKLINVNDRKVRCILYGNEYEE